MRYLAAAPEEVTRRDLARTFKLKGQERADLRAMMRALEDDGLLERGHKKRVRTPGRLPAVTVIDVTAVDEDGDLIAEPASKKDVTDDAPGPRIHLVDTGRGRAPRIGDRVLAKLSHLEQQVYEGRVIKILPRAPNRVIGVLEQARDGLVVRPLDRGAGRELRLERAHAGEAVAGDLVVVESRDDRPLDQGPIRVTERLGQADDVGAISLLSAHQHDLRIDFPQEILELAERATPAMLDGRADLRDLPLVTIDGADARDFDDAVFARPDDHKDNPGGWRITVAIADVAHYVRPGDALDVEAKARGNSTYFPDRVLPMLPEALSNGLCSLRPAEDRACLAVHIWLDRHGRKTKHRFERGLMRSAARLTYEQVQAARDGRRDELTQPLMETVIEPLYGAFAALFEARQRRGTLDLDLPELRILLDEHKRPVDIGRAERLDAHRLIEEFMIMANVAAAETLETKAAPCMYRVHDKPDQTKLEGVGQLLKSLGIVRQGILNAKPKDLARLLDNVRDHPLGPLVSSLLLRAQSQAQYTPHNIGHYGLNLGRYAHFTSPIRRYADLLVHRSLIAALKLGEGGLSDDIDIETFLDIGEKISACERKSMVAERSAKDRYIAMLMAERIGDVFKARITSVHRFGLFVQFEETLADALVPISTISANRLDHDEAEHALVDRDAGAVWSIGDPVEVELVEVDAAMGRLACRLVGHTPGPRTAAILKSRRRRKAPAARGRRRRF
ncbi:MAG: ribonuclease R [Alphaproteobacteria bacterium]|nr:ribonuclease R [Alphaproteobacteria bacterium]